MRTCKICSIILLENNPSRYGLKCRVCYNEYQKQWRINNRDKFNANMLRWSKNNRETANRIAKRWRDKNKEHYNEYHRIYQLQWKKNKDLNDKKLG